MAFHNNPRIVTDGLTLCLDANAPSSYPDAGDINTGWQDSGSNQANYVVLGKDSVKLIGSSTAWVGRFYAWPAAAVYTIMFDYVCDSGSCGVTVDNDGVTNDVFNASLTATTTKQSFVSTKTITSAGASYIYIRRNSGSTDITISNFRYTRNIWHDLSGNNNDATIVNATHNSNGYFTFDGTDDYMTCTTATGWTSLTDMSAFVIARPTTISRRHYLFDSRYSGSTLGFGLGLDSNNSPFHFAQDSAGYDEAGSPTTFSVNNFFIFGLFRQGNSIQILDSDSVTKISPSLSGPNSLGTGTLTPGGYTIGGPYTINNIYTWIGDIAAIWVYNKVLSQAESTQNYKAMKSRFGV